MLEDHLDLGGDGMLSLNRSLDEIRSSLRKRFDENKDFTINLKGIRAISPSFAYQCFGCLYEDKKDLETLLDRMDVQNDVFNFKDKIQGAIRRRIAVLSA